MVKFMAYAIITLSSGTQEVDLEAFKTFEKCRYEVKRRGDIIKDFNWIKFKCRKIYEEK